MEYRAVTKEDPNKDLTHWKYIKREKKNGKWRYYYDKDTVKKDLDYIKQETSRTVQNAKYEANDKLLKYQQNTADSLGAYSIATINRGYNSVLKTLNNIGKGKLDDKIESFRDKAMKILLGLFN